MKQDRLYFIQELLIIQINNLILYPLILMFVTLLRAFAVPVRTSMVLWMVCGTLPIILYWARCHIKKFIPFILVHMVVLGVAVLIACFGADIPLPIFQTLDNGVNRYGMLSLIAVLTACSIGLRLHEKTSSKIISMPVAVGISAGTLFFQHFMGINEWDSYYKLSLILVLVMFFFYYYLSQYLNFLTVNSNSAGVFPEKEILYSGMCQTFLYTVFGTVILILTSQNTWLKSILNVLRQILSVMVRFIFGFFSYEEAPEESERLITQQNAMDMGMSVQGSETAPIWVILEYIVMLAVALVILAAIYKLLKKVIAFIKSVMAQKLRTHEEVITDVRDVREKCDTVKELRKKRQLSEVFAIKDYKERIRRIYKKKASSYKPAILGKEDGKNRFRREKLSVYTAREMEAEMQALPFAEIYEKARYSKEACTAQDVRRMKELCREKAIVD